MSSKKTNFVAIILLITLTLTFLAGSVSASTGVIASNSNGSINTAGIQNNHPSSNSSASALGQAFNVTTTAYITTVTVQMYKTGTATGTLTMYIYGLTGSYGTTAVPNSTLIDTSTNTIDIASLPGGLVSRDFTFSGQVQLTENTQYTFAVEASDGTFAGYVYLQIRTSSSYAGNAFNYVTSGWSPQTYDLFFTVYGSDTPIATPIPSATSGVTIPYPDTSGITAIANYLIALFIILLPAGILGVFFRFGTWGFITGLAIGAGLGYVIMPTVVPLWLFFAAIIGIVGMIMKPTGDKI